MRKILLSLIFFLLLIQIAENRNCPVQYIANYSYLNSSDFECIHCNTVIKYCEICENKNYCLKCEDNYYFINGVCIKQNLEQSKWRGLSEITEPKDICKEPSCYDYDCQCCSGGTFIATPYLKKTINPLITHLIVKKKENSQKSSLLTETMLMYQMKFYMFYLETSGDEQKKKFLTENTDYTYWVKDVTLPVDNDLWKFEIHVNYTKEHDQLMHKLIIMHNQAYTMKVNGEEIDIPLCQLEYDPNTTSIATYKYYEISTQYNQIMNDQSELSQWASIFVYIFAVATTLEGGSVGFRTINSIQISYLIKFCNQTLPPVLERILMDDNQMINYDIFHANEKTTDKIELQDRFYDWSLSPFFINNSGEYLFILAVILGTSIVVWGVDMVFEKKQMLEIKEKLHLTRKERIINSCKQF